MIYADAASTTRLSQTALEKAFPFLRDSFGNPSSRHSLGVAAKRALEEARALIAESIGAEPEEIVFTSGASEANAWIISNVGGGKTDAETRRVGVGRVVASAIEHPSVRKMCEALKRRNVGVEYLPVDRDGIVSVDALKTTLAAARKGNVNLSTIMFANNEIGAIQPIEEIGALLRTFDVPFHTDATQAVGHIPLDVRNLNVDFLTASAHKFNGPKGMGFLFCRRGVAVLPILEGGGQERGLRAGTENVAGAVATAYALAENVANLAETTVKTRRITTEIVERLQTALPQGAFTVVGDEARRLPGTINLVFKDVRGDALVQILDLKGVCASTGSACSSGKTEPSPTALALGFSPEAAKSSVRLSFDRDNSPSDAAVVAEALAFAYRKITAAQRRQR
ncbi:MAG: cysteine desulfurase [Thermoguttaceae bacterium]|nr:cysteine desulfurase [Thermoguttaceae bacterium]MBQ9800804.1 cysteine desulfurase [Thermoguttaceae bacterium]